MKMIDESRSPLGKIDRTFPLFDESLNAAQRLAFTFFRLAAQGGGSQRYKAAHAPRGTYKARRPHRYLTGYVPAMSSPGGVADRLSHALGRP